MPADLKNKETHKKKTVLNHSFQDALHNANTEKDVILWKKQTNNAVICKFHKITIENVKCLNWETQF